MIIANEFSVAAAPDDVYALMLDVENVAPCIPGAQVERLREDGAYDAKVTVKLGPVTMAYKGTVAIEERDDAARRAALKAKATEARGQGTAQATVTMQVEPQGSGSHVAIETDMLVTGRVAQMGQGIMKDVATRMIGEMARCIEARLSAPAAAAEAAPADADGSPAPAAAAAPPPVAKPINGLALGWSVFAGRIKRLFGHR